MSTRRNDLCPCGSGKKYKKCCMKKEVVIELQEHFLEQFYEQKAAIVNKLGNHIMNNFTYNDYQQLKTSFNRRVGSNFQENKNDELFHFWLYFFHQFENGLRGIEWYYKDNEHRLNGDEKEMTKRWTALKPKLLQAVNKTDEVIVFEDVLTKEQFSLANKEENIPYFLPWMGTFALIELFQDKYYFNGVRAFVEPNDIRRAEIKVEELTVETNKNYEQVYVENYMEILETVFTDEAVEYAEEEEDKLLEYILTYELKDEVIILEYLRSHPELQIDTWTAEEKTLSWLNNWQAYEDSEVKSTIKLAEVKGTIEITKDHLEFKSYDKEKTKEMKLILDKHRKSLWFMREQINTISTLGVQVKNNVVFLEDSTPQYFQFYAQHALINELDEPIPLLNDQSLRQLVDNKSKDAEIWLRQSEYNLYRTVLQQFDRVDITADFNTVRKELELPLSPFVTGGEKRKTSYQAIESEVTSGITEDDIPYLEALGFMPQTIDNFYTMDFVRFYKEKIIGKSQTTERKYRNSLYELREILEQETVDSWEECNISFWENLIIEEHGHSKDVYSKTEWNDFLNTIKTLLIWLEQLNKVTNPTETVLFMKKFTK